MYVCLFVYILTQTYIHILEPLQYGKHITTIIAASHTHNNGIPEHILQFFFDDIYIYIYI